MAHKVESSHQQNQIRKKHPVSPKRNFPLAQERLRNTGPSSLGRPAHRLPLLVRICLGQQEAEDDDQHGRARAEPEERPPPVRGGVDEAPGEGCRQEVAEGVALLEYAGHQPSGLLGEILESGGGCISVQAAHGNAEQGPTSEELAISLAEAGALCPNISVVLKKNIL